MFRHIAVFTIGLAAIANLNAGPLELQVGGASGLTAGTVVQTVTGGPTGTIGETTYVGNLPPGSTGLTGIAGVPAAPGVPSGYPSGESLTSNGVTFSMIDDTGANAGANTWISSNTTGSTTTDTITMGVFGVENVWTMLNDQYGIAGSTTQVVFNFGSTPTVANDPSVTFTLVNGTSITDAVDCITGSCPAYPTTLSTSTYGINDTTAPTFGAPSVSAWNVWEGAYSGTPAGAYAGMTNGDVYLDAQNFTLGGVYSQEYLVSIQIIDSDPSSRASRDVLSAITVGVAPEPSTWLLFAAGLGAVILVRRRSKAIV